MGASTPSTSEPFRGRTYFRGTWAASARRTAFRDTPSRHTMPLKHGFPRDDYCGVKPSSDAGSVYDLRQVATAKAVQSRLAFEQFVSKVLLLALLGVLLLVGVPLMLSLTNTAAHHVRLPTAPATSSK